MKSMTRTPSFTPARWFAALLLPVASMVMLAPSAHAQATRTWVSGVGDDANPCSRTAPCKTFAGAISKTAAGGVISVLDPGGFGTVTITKSITIDGGGLDGSILNSNTNGVIINGLDIDVTLRHLSLDFGARPATCNELSGVTVLKARSLRMDNVTIAGSPNGVTVSPGTPATERHLDVALNNVDISGACGAGIRSLPTAPATVRLTLAGTRVSHSSTALRLGAGAEAWVRDSGFDLNDVGISRTGGVAHRGCNVSVAGNATDGTFTDRTCDVASAAPVKPVQPAQSWCTVPKVVAIKRAAAVSKLSAATCNVGKVRTVKKAKKWRGKVVSQSIPKGIQVRPGTKVNLVVSR